MENSRYSLKLRESLYTSNLYKSTFPHGCYFNVFNSCKRQTVFNGDIPSIPLLSDFTSINANDNMFLTQSFPESKAFFLNSPEDICFELVREKHNYNKYFQHCRKKYKNQYKQINQNMKRRRSDIHLPVYIINLCNTNDPDQYFDTFYNWYYTGGILDTISIDNQDYFIGIVENKLCIRYLNNTKIKQKYQLVDGQIFNISSYSYDNKSYATLRGKNNLKLIHFDFENEELVLHEDWRAFDKTPFIDCKLYARDTIGSINMQNNFKSIDLETNKTLIEHRIAEKAEKPNRYCLFDCIDKQNLLFMEREKIKSFDLRSSKECLLLTLESFPMSRCEQLCHFIVSKNNPNYIFACMSHTIAKVDLRNKNIVKQWSHLLTSPPIMMDSLSSSGHEYLCISSFKDRIIICSTPEENNLPKLVPTPMHTFTEVNFEQQIILEGLNKRLQSSINGLKLTHDSKNNIKIHYSNAFGDLFCNDVQLKSISQSRVNNTVAHEKMKKWLKSLQRKVSNEPKIIYATEIATEWSSIKQLHCKNIYQERLAKYQDETEVKLDLGIDPYAFDMSAIWGPRTDEIQLPEESSSVKKVTEWLNIKTELLDT